MSKNLNERQQKAIALLCAGKSAVQVAKEINIRQETLSRWKSDPTFEKELEKWRLTFFEGILQRQFHLFFEAQQKIEEAFDDEDLTSYQKANLALRLMSMFSGNTNVNRQLAIKTQDLRFKDDNWFR